MSDYEDVLRVTASSNNNRQGRAACAVRKRKDDLEIEALEAQTEADYLIELFKDAY